MSDLLQYVEPEWVADMPEDAQFITLPGTDRYLPLEDTPQLYLGFASLGEKVWANPELSVSELAELALEFTREYGAIEGGTHLTLKDIIDEAQTVAWMVKSYLAVGSTAEAAEAGEKFWERSIAKYGEGIAQYKETQLPPGSDAEKRFMSSMVEHLTNEHLKTHTVWQQVKVVFGDLAQPPLPPGFEPTYEASSLQGCIWVQFASLLMRESVWRRCEYDKCRKVFEAPSPRSRHEYCPTLDLEKDGCQVKAKNQRRYARRRANQLQASIQQDGE